MTTFDEARMEWEFEALRENKNGGVQIVGKNGAQYIVRDGVEVARVTVDDPQEVAR
jgi:hypothetical protein